MSPLQSPPSTLAPPGKHHQRAFSTPKPCKPLAWLSPGGQILIIGEQDHMLAQLSGLVLPVGRALKDVIVPNVAVPVGHQGWQEGQRISRLPHLWLHSMRAASSAVGGASCTAVGRPVPSPAAANLKSLSVGLQSASSTHGVVLGWKLRLQPEAPPVLQRQRIQRTSRQATCNHHPLNLAYSLSPL